VHNKVRNALEITSREETNKSLQILFKEMNDHTTNTFEFGKIFLSFLLFSAKKIGSNLSTTVGYDGKSMDTGKLHYLLEKTTHVVFDTYVKDMEQAQRRIYGPRSTYGIDNSEAKLNDKTIGTDAHEALIRSRLHGNVEISRKCGYDISIRGFETTTLSLSPTVFLIKVEDPKGHQWIVRRSWNDFEALHALLAQELSISNNSAFMELVFPVRARGLASLTASAEYNEGLAIQLDGYCILLMGIILELNNRAQNALAKFLDARYIILTGSDKLNYAESIPNAFLPIKRVFERQAMDKRQSSEPSAVQSITGPGRLPSVAEADAEFVRDIFSDKELDECRRVWGVEYSLRIFEAYAQLQRLATILGWTLEINHFFISMFGNTVAFSKLPLRDIVTALKELLVKFLANVQELYGFACQLNADSKYKWHKNLQMAENELTRVKFHVEKALGVISIIETDHLDFETQMRRLKDVYARFQPFMNRVGPSLQDITAELDLPSPQYTLADFPRSSYAATITYPLEEKDADEHGGPSGLFSRSLSKTSLPAMEHTNPLNDFEDGSSFAPIVPDGPDITQDIRTEESSTVCVIS
jgi:hypothetical protein